jgi:hypothetical protein
MIALSLSDCIVPQRLALVLAQALGRHAHSGQPQVNQRLVCRQDQKEADWQGQAGRQAGNETGGHVLLLASTAEFSASKHAMG